MLRIRCMGCYSHLCWPGGGPSFFLPRGAVLAVSCVRLCYRGSVRHASFSTRLGVLLCGGRTTLLLLTLWGRGDRRGLHPTLYERLGC